VVRHPAGRRTLLNRALLVATGVTTVFTLFLGVGFVLIATISIKASLFEGAEETAEEIAGVLVGPLYALNDEIVASIAQAYLTTGTLTGIEIQSSSGETIVDSRPGHTSIVPAVERAVYHDALYVGKATFWFSDDELHDARARLLSLSGVLVLGIILAYALSVRLIVGGMMSRAFRPVMSAIEHVSAGHYGRQFAEGKYRDVNAVIATLNTMSRRIKSKDRELRGLNRTLEERVEARTAELETSLEQLTQAQSKLSIAEKIMSLGTLVAGVSHEVNTPLGVAVTAATHLQAEFEKLKDAYDADELMAVEELFDLLLRNLGRAASVVEYFRKVTVNEVADEVVQFSLKELVIDSVESLKPRLAKHGITVVVTGDSGQVWSYAGSIYPIVTNLLVNSFTHAYVDGEGGTVDISVTKTDAGVTLSYRDYGVGMTKAVQQRVFEPFFTTSRGAGGTGLGMYAVYNTVTQKLDGLIEVSSTPGEGTSVVISLPSITPKGI
jgi:signal transduction histidine kinase